MNHPRALLFTAVVTLGVASLLASSAPPVFLYASTLNNLGYRDSYPTYACKGETVTFAWNEPGASLTLRADPAGSLEPPLGARQVESRGRLEFTAQGDAEVVLESRDDPSGTLYLRLLPDTLCEAFGFPLVGWYEGALVQTSPAAQTLPRQLALYAEETFDEQVLYVGISEDVSRYPSLTAPCILDAVAARLKCEDMEVGGENAGSTFEFDAQITESGLRGTYSGVRVSASSAVPFAGTLSFGKRPGTPPSDQPDPSEPR